MWDLRRNALRLMHALWPGHGETDLTVQIVRGGDADRLDTGVGDDLPPVPGRGLEAVPPGGLLGPAGHLVGDGDQTWAQRELREVVEHACVRLGVHPPHPAESNDGDAEHVHHDSPSLDRSKKLAGPR